MGFTACWAAYAEGEEWLETLIAYLGGNLDFIRDFLHGRLPEIRLVESEGTYLAWLDAGPIFGPGGAGFQRVNFACPRAVLEKALGQIELAVRLCSKG